MSDTDAELTYDEYESWRHELNTRGWLMVSTGDEDHLQERAAAWRQEGHDTRITRNPITRRLCLFTRLPQ